MSKITFSISLQEELFNLVDDDFKTFMHQEFYKIMLPYIPFATGCLSSTLNEEQYKKEQGIANDDYVTSLAMNRGNINANGITFNSSYAEECYYATRSFNPSYHPLATSSWGDVAFSANKEQLEKTLTDYLERKTKNG